MDKPRKRIPAGAQGAAPTSPQPSPSQGEGAGTLATVEIADISQILAHIQVLFVALAVYDSRFGRNGWPIIPDPSGDPRKAQTPPRARRFAEGWEHPALQTYLTSKGYTNWQDLKPEELKSIEWNLEKKLTQFRQEAGKS